VNAEDFIRAHTALSHAPLVPEIALHLASELTPLWQASEAWLAGRRLDPPFWAFAWPGGQALARFCLDAPEHVRARSVLDFAAGCGIAAIAAARAGAARVEAAEIDRFAAAACGLNARHNGVALTTLDRDIVGEDRAWQTVLAGDVCYEAPMTRRVLPWLRGLAARGAAVWLADPGRAYLPQAGLIPVVCYRVPTSLELEDRPARDVTVYRLLAA
jgi:predicted nicotinamide N-methyase